MSYILEIIPAIEEQPKNYNYVYPSNIGQYSVGEIIVKGYDDRTYKCKIGWCNINSDVHYAPGKGIAYRDTWEHVE